MILSKSSLPLCLGFLPSDGDNIITSTTQRVIEIMDVKVLLNHNELVYDEIVLLLILTAGQLIYGLKGYDSNGEISIEEKSGRHSSLLALMTRILQDVSWESDPCPGFFIKSLLVMKLQEENSALCRCRGREKVQWKFFLS